MDSNHEAPPAVSTPVLIGPQEPVGSVPLLPINDLHPATVIDFDRVLDSPQATKIVQACTTQQLLAAVAKRGVADSLELLELTSKAQFTRLLDYVAWRQGRLDSKSMFGWLAAYKEIERSQYFERFADLEEEYQLAALGAAINLVDQDQYEALSSDDQDLWSALPCGTLYYSIKEQDQELRGAIEELITIGLEQDINYTYMLLAHAAFLPPNEAEADLQRFRRARLEEDGFVDREESLTSLLPLKGFEVQSLIGRYSHLVPEDQDAVYNRYCNSISKPDDKSKERGPLVFFIVCCDGLLKIELTGLPLLVSSSYRAADESMSNISDIGNSHHADLKELLSPNQQIQQIQQTFTHLVNGLCTGLDIEPDDTAGQQQLMVQAEGLVSLGLETISQSNIKAAAHLISERHPKVLLRAALTLIEEVRRQVSDLFESLNHQVIPSITRHLATGRLASIRRSIDRHILDELGFERVEHLKALFETIPQAVEEGSLSRDLGKFQNQNINCKARRSIASLADLRMVRGQISAILWLIQHSDHLPLNDHFALRNHLPHGSKPDQITLLGGCRADVAFTTTLVVGLLHWDNKTCAEPALNINSMPRVRLTEVKQLQSWTDQQFDERLDETLGILEESLLSNATLRQWASSKYDNGLEQAMSAAIQYLKVTAWDCLTGLRMALQSSDSLPIDNLARLVAIKKDD